MKSSIALRWVLLLTVYGRQLVTASTSVADSQEHERTGRQLEHHGGGHNHNPMPTPRPPPRQSPQGPPPVFPVTAMVQASHQQQQHFQQQHFQQQHHGQQGYYSHGGGNHHNPYHYPQPTDRPTPYPTPRPTDRPTPYPTPYPNSYHHPIPYPTRHYDPTAKPTVSMEPSEYPTTSEEPSETPTESLEPSETPTMSVEPSEFPTETMEPTDDALLTIAEFICLDDNEILFGVLCELLDLAPAVAAILNSDLFVDVSEFDGLPGFDPTIFTAQFRSAGLRMPVSHTNLANRGNRNLQISNIRNREKLTLFAPINSALMRLLYRPINELFDETDAEVLDFFEAIDLDITSTNTIFYDYLLTNEGRFTLNQILLTHILNQVIESNKLRCNKMYDTLSGQVSATECEREGQPQRLYKFQVGDGNTMSDRPGVFATNTPSSNGVVHVVDDVILPVLTLPPDDWKFPDDAHGIILVNSELLARAPGPYPYETESGTFLGAPIIRTQDPTETP